MIQFDLRNSSPHHQHSFRSLIISLIFVITNVSRFFLPQVLKRENIKADHFRSLHFVVLILSNYGLHNRYFVNQNLASLAFISSWLISIYISFLQLSSYSQLSFTIESKQSWWASIFVFRLRRFPTKCICGVFDLQWYHYFVYVCYAVFLSSSPCRVAICSFAILYLTNLCISTTQLLPYAFTVFNNLLFDGHATVYFFGTSILCNVR